MQAKLLHAVLLLPLLWRPLQPSAHAAAVTPLPLGATEAGQADDPAFAAGTRAMNENRWADAVTSFDQSIQAKGHRADAALYWKAYSLNKVGKPELAFATCVQLRTLMPASSWNRDCSALKLAQIVAAPRPAHSDPAIGITLDMPTPLLPARDSPSRDPNTEIKILALNSLLHRDPAQAVPLLRTILTGDQTPDVKHHALFILAQSRSPEAEATMRDLLLGKMGADLQSSAIQSAGVYEGRRLNDTLVEVYKSTADTRVKRSVISAFFVSNDDVRLVDLARSEKNLELKRTIVSQLSLMRGKAASDYMLELLK